MRIYQKQVIITKNNNNESLLFRSLYFQCGPTYIMTYDAKRKNEKDELQIS